MGGWVGEHYCEVKVGAAQPATAASDAPSTKTASATHCTPPQPITPKQRRKARARACVRACVWPGGRDGRVGVTASLVVWIPISIAVTPMRRLFVSVAGVTYRQPPMR